MNQEDDIHDRVIVIHLLLALGVLFLSIAEIC